MPLTLHAAHCAGGTVGLACERCPVGFWFEEGEGICERCDATIGNAETLFPYLLLGVGSPIIAILLHLWFNSTQEVIEVEDDDELDTALLGTCVSASSSGHHKPPQSSASESQRPQNGAITRQKLMKPRLSRYNGSTASSRGQSALGRWQRKSTMEYLTASDVPTPSASTKSDDLSVFAMNALAKAPHVFKDRVLQEGLDGVEDGDVGDNHCSRSLEQPELAKTTTLQDLNEKCKDAKVDTLGTTTLVSFPTSLPQVPNHSVGRPARTIVSWSRSRCNCPRPQGSESDMKFQVW